MKYILACLFVLFSFGSKAQKIDHHLQNKLTELLKEYTSGEVGVYVYDLNKNKIAAYHEDTIFPTASIVKIPILIGIMHQINEGHLQYHQSLIYTDSLYYSEGEDILASFKFGEKIELAKLLMLMLSTSDNTASLWLQGLAGSGTTINQYLEELGLKNTRVNSRTDGRKENWKQYGWGQTTPKEMTNLMKLIVDNKIINKTISERMLRLLSRQYWDEYALSEIPPNVMVASKGGAVDASRSEVVYVSGEHPYIFCINTKNNKDTSWQSNNEAWVLTRKLSVMLWKYFNPNSTWEASPLIP